MDFFLSVLYGSLFGLFIIVCLAILIWSPKFFVLLMMVSFCFLVGFAIKVFIHGP